MTSLLSAFIAAHPELAPTGVLAIFLGAAWIARAR